MLWFWHAHNGHVSFFIFLQWGNMWNKDMKMACLGICYLHEHKCPVQSLACMNIFTTRRQSSRHILMSRILHLHVVYIVLIFLKFKHVCTARCSLCSQGSSALCIYVYLLLRTLCSKYTLSSLWRRLYIMVYLFLL